LLRPVALKVLRGDDCNNLVRRSRLLREARAAFSLNHPNIVVVYDIVSDIRNSEIEHFVRPTASVRAMPQRFPRHSADDSVPWQDRSLAGIPPVMW